MSKILAIFVDDLEAVKFVQDGNVLDPRLVLRALCSGAMRVVYDKQIREPESLQRIYVLSETFTIEQAPQ